MRDGSAGLERHAFRIPMTTRFRRVAHRQGVIVRGPAGWGEFSPFAEYGDDYAARWFAAAREAATIVWPEPVRDEVPVNATVPAVGPEEAHHIVRESGCSTVKVKVAEPGQAVEDDLARLEAVRDALGRAGRLRIDANGAWDADTAVARIRTFDRFDLEYVEQPAADLPGLAAVRRRVDVPIAVDESIRTAEDPLAVATTAAEAADVVVLKVQPLGGVRAALRVAEAIGLTPVVSSAIETSVGLAAGLALAAALPELPHACGLATQSLLAGDVVGDPLVAVDGTLTVRRPEPTREGLARWRAPDEDALLARAAAAEDVDRSSPYVVPGRD